MTDFVITGATGMLGRALLREFAGRSVVGTGLTRTGPNVERLDLLNEASLATFLARHQPRLVIHAAAERRPDIGEREPERTRALNVGVTATLGRLARDTGAHVLYISTDYVFDGTRPPYAPQDATNPLNFYGQTKLDGEQALFAATPEASVLRVGVLFGQVETPEESAVTTLLRDVRGPAPKAIDDWGRRYPTSTGEVAALCRNLAERHLSGTSIAGIWHWCGRERLTKYAQALALGQALGLSTAHLSPDPMPAGGTPRPRDCRLDCSAAEALGLGRHVPFREALARSLFASGITASQTSGL